MALVFLTACKSSVEPISGDRYALESISGAPLPAPYSAIPEETNRIHSDTLILAPDGSGERRTVYDSFQGTKRKERTSLTYTNVSGRIEVALACATPPCLSPPHLTGTLQGTAITITTSKVTRVPLVFRRAFPPD